jgi:hypothetical protein
VSAHIRAIHTEVKGEYGWPRMYKELLAIGYRVVTTGNNPNMSVALDLVQQRFTSGPPPNCEMATSLRFSVRRIVCDFSSFS